LKIARDFAADAADEDKIDTKSAFPDQAEDCNANKNATPGYESTYVPRPCCDSSAGSKYSPAKVGPKNLW
jgi:hypothetical protein